MTQTEPNILENESLPKIKFILSEYPRRSQRKERMDECNLKVTMSILGKPCLLELEMIALFSFCKSA